MSTSFLCLRDGSQVIEPNMFGGNERPLFSTSQIRYGWRTIVRRAMASNLAPHGQCEPLSEWRLLEIYSGEQHLVGRFGGTRRYWATAPLVRLEPSSRRAVANDGQEYVLVGEPGLEAAAQFFITLCAAFDSQLASTKDLTETMLSRQRWPIGKSNLSARMGGVIGDEHIKRSGSSRH